MISCQFSLYPLGVDDLSPAIDAAVAEMKALGLDLDVGPMSTQVTGDTGFSLRRIEASVRCGRARRARSHDRNGLQRLSSMNPTCIHR
jgi:uncharacterized protein YqgV (UPF0045/DUF77 family)